MSPPDPQRALILRRKATQDLATVQALATNREIADEIIGFHAQQTVEKSLKAVLLAKGVGEQRTHDIGRLLQLAEEHDVPEPPHADSLDELTIYAVPLRYDQLLDAEPLDRTTILGEIEAVAEWCAAILDN